MLVAAKLGDGGLEDGLKAESQFLRRIGVDLDAVSLNDGQGGETGDVTAPKATLQLLRYMYGSPDYQIYKDALPILGVDGSLAMVETNSSTTGKVLAKTGTVATYDGLNDRGILLAKALAGYTTSAQGRNLSFAVLVNNVPIADLDKMNKVGNDLGRIAAMIYEGY
jgi:D-alanyl-D-alanine carboxypeptidase/D-alanyl-D-alanine-endopeptidase (penicillin-binding protein 4)